MAAYAPPLEEDRVTARMSAAHVLVRSVLAMAVLSACGVPSPGDPPPGPSGPSEAGAEVDTLVPLDEGSATLAAQLLLVRDRATDVRSILAAVTTEAGSPADPADDAVTLAILRALGDDAVGSLLGAPAGGTGAGLLPAVEPDRGGTATDDLTTGLITVAGDVGGERSRLVVELVRDPLLGDLGAWQRDPVGVIAILRAIADAHAAPGVDPATLDAAVLEIPGELTRVLAYALVIATTEDVTVAAHAAERAGGHIGVVIIAVELALERLGTA